jgi:DNA-binding response OmpR family regulator
MHILSENRQVSLTPADEDRISPVPEPGQQQPAPAPGGLVVDPNTRTVSADGQPVRLTPKEYEILELLSSRNGKTLTKEMILNHLYGGKDEPALKIIDVFVCKLRKKLALSAGNKHYIETVWGRGYRLCDPTQLPQATPAALPPAASPKGLDDRSSASRLVADSERIPSSSERPR